MLSNIKNSFFIPCLETEEAQNIDSKNSVSEACVSQNGQGEVCNDTLSNENGKIDASCQNRSNCVNDLDVTNISTASTNGVCTSYGWTEGLGKKTEMFNDGSTKTSQRKKNIKRMHANLSGTKYAVGMYRYCKMYNSIKNYKTRCSPPHARIAAMSTI